MVQQHLGRSLRHHPCGVSLWEEAGGVWEESARTVAGAKTHLVVLVCFIVPCIFVVLPEPGCSLFLCPCDDLLRKTQGWSQEFLPGGWGELCVVHRWA